MNAYLAERQRLILQDRALRADHATETHISDDERKADEILRRTRAVEADTVWNPKLSKQLPESQRVFPGRARLVHTKLFEILNGLLHAHLGAVVRADVLLRLALEQAAMHVRVQAVLAETMIKTTLPVCSALPKSDWTTHLSITDAGYEPNSWVPINNARANFSTALGGPEGFDRWVTSTLAIDSSEAYGTHNTTDEVRTLGLIFYEPVLANHIRELFVSSIEDGIAYVEMRMIFHAKYIIGADGKKDVYHRAWLELYDNIIEDIKLEMRNQAREDEFVGSKIIYTVLRTITPEELEWCLEDCIVMKQAYPLLIAGFDPVGHEDTLRPLIYYANALLRFVERQKDLGIDIPFCVPRGRSARRCFSLVKHPKHLQICREREICVARLAASMPMHPLPAVMNQGAHVALYSDDSAVSGNMGLSFDFYQVFVASEVNGLITLRELVWDSIKCSCLDEQKRVAAAENLQRRLATFVRYVLEWDGANRHPC
ncbi:Metallo-dependent hydrolase [Trametes elegans]|nr:Metallo-dependent hydrolase [Trametes elegans]